MSDQSSRREFLKHAAVAGAIAAAGNQSASAQQQPPPSERAAAGAPPTSQNKLNIAGIGVGGKGESDLGGCAKSPNVNIVALCDVDEKTLGKAKEKYSGAKTYYDFRKMLET